MVDWLTEPEESSPPGAKAAAVFPELWGMVDPLWFMTLSEGDQRKVFRSLCHDNGWYWPQVSKLMRHVGDPNGINSLTPSQRIQQARMAAHSSWARTVDPGQRTSAARQAFLSRFERQVDPDGTMSPQERTRRAVHAKRAHFAELALKSSRKRSRKSR